MDVVRVKRTLRQLKRQECLLRFGQPSAPPHARLVWDACFSIGNKETSSSRYTLKDLLAMDADAWRDAIAEYYFDLYQQRAGETGMPSPYHNREALARMGLPADADAQAIRERFRQLAKETHPDVGGDHQGFVALMDAYRSLMEEL